MSEQHTVIDGYARPKKHRSLSRTQFSFIMKKVLNNPINQKYTKFSESSLQYSDIIHNKRTKQSTILEEENSESPRKIPKVSYKLSGVPRDAQSIESGDIESERISDSSSSLFEDEFDDTDNHQSNSQNVEDIGQCLLESNQQEEYQIMINQCLQLEASTPEEIQEREVALGPNMHKKTIIFDLDETLVSAKTQYFLLSRYKDEEERNDQKENTFENIDITIEFDSTFLLNINAEVRPHFHEVMRYLSKNYELGIFTAAQQQYCDSILEQLDPLNEYFSFRLYRQHCIPRGKHLVKDLRIIKDRDLANMCLIDNSMISFAFQLSNGVPIGSFNGTKEEKDDEELAIIAHYVVQGFENEDFRKYNSAQLQLEQFQTQQGGSSLQE